MRRILKIVATVATIQLLMNIPALAQSAPRILLIAREPLSPGAEAEYDRIESETAILAAKLECPHKTNEAWNAALTKNQALR